MIRCFLVTIILFLSNSVSADLILPFTGSTGMNNVDISGIMRGYRFQVLNNVTVGALGVLDVGADGWTGPPATFVGLWTDTAILLGSVEVANTSPLDSTVFTANAFSARFRRETLAVPILLTPGFYRVAAELGDITEASDFYVGVTPTGLHSDIGSIQNATREDNTENAFPSDLGTFGVADLGGTIFLEITAVPEPSSACLIALGLAAFGIVRLRRR